MRFQGKTYLCVRMRPTPGNHAGRRGLVRIVTYVVFYGVFLHAKDSFFDRAVSERRAIVIDRACHQLIDKGREAARFDGENHETLAEHLSWVRILRGRGGDGCSNWGRSY